MTGRRRLLTAPSAHAALPASIRSTTAKALGLVALAALLAMAFIGASRAMAETTYLCGVDEATCTSRVTHLHETTLSGHPAELLSSLGTVKCDVLFLGDAVDGTSAPLELSGAFTYSNCVRGSEKCTATEEGGPSIVEVLDEAAEEAKVTGEGEFKVKCGIFINCKYNHEGLQGTDKGPLSSTETNGEVTLSEQEIHKVSGTCPSTAKLDITTTPLETVYIATGAVPETQKVVLKPIQNGGMCPENAGRVVFTFVEQTCEYYLENQNAFESIEVRKVVLGIETKCGGLINNCIELIATSNSPRCEVPGYIFSGTTLAPAGRCYVKLRYEWKPPTTPSLSSLEIATKSTLGGTATVIVGQSLN